MQDTPLPLQGVAVKILHTIFSKTLRDTEFRKHHRIQHARFYRKQLKFLLK